MFFFPTYKVLIFLNVSQRLAGSPWYMPINYTLIIISLRSFAFIFLSDSLKFWEYRMTAFLYPVFLSIRPFIPGSLQLCMTWGWGADYYSWFAEIEYGLFSSCFLLSPAWVWWTPSQVPSLAPSVVQTPVGTTGKPLAVSCGLAPGLRHLGTATQAAHGRAWLPVSH